MGFIFYSLFPGLNIKWIDKSFKTIIHSKIICNTPPFMFTFFLSIYDYFFLKLKLNSCRLYDILTIQWSEIGTQQTYSRRFKACLSEMEGILEHLCVRFPLLKEFTCKTLYASYFLRKKKTF